MRTKVVLRATAEMQRWKAVRMCRMQYLGVSSFKDSSDLSYNQRGQKDTATCHSSQDHLALFQNLYFSAFLCYY